MGFCSSHQGLGFLLHDTSACTTCPTIRFHSAQSIFDLAQSILSLAHSTFNLAQPLFYLARLAMHLPRIPFCSAKLRHSRNSDDQYASCCLRVSLSHALPSRSSARLFAFASQIACIAIRVCNVGLLNGVKYFTGAAAAVAVHCGSSVGCGSCKVFDPLRGTGFLILSQGLGF